MPRKRKDDGRIPITVFASYPGKKHTYVMTAHYLIDSSVRYHVMYWHRGVRPGYWAFASRHRSVNAASRARKRLERRGHRTMVEIRGDYP